jgi:hypothetical protein
MKKYILSGTMRCDDFSTNFFVARHVCCGVFDALVAGLPNISGNDVDGRPLCDDTAAPAASFEKYGSEAQAEDDADDDAARRMFKGVFQGAHVVVVV